MKAKPLPPVERVRELLDYHPESGLLVWKVNSGIAWLIYYGKEPSKNIDHINQCKSDNRIENLRLASKSENGMNRGAQKNSQSGIKGIHWDKTRNKWFVQFRGQKIGRFSDLEQAKLAFQSAVQSSNLAAFAPTLN